MTSWLIGDCHRQSRQPRGSPSVLMEEGTRYPVLYRFACGERDLTLETASRLADYFGMRLTPPRRPKKGG